MKNTGRPAIMRIGIPCPGFRPFNLSDEDKKARIYAAGQLEIAAMRLHAPGYMATRHNLKPQKRCSTCKQAAKIRAQARGLRHSAGDHSACHGD